jgi:hypothetical protein
MMKWLAALSIKLQLHLRPVCMQNHDRVIIIISAEIAKKVVHRLAYSIIYSLIIVKHELRCHILDNIVNLDSAARRDHKPVLSLHIEMSLCAYRRLRARGAIID